MQTATANGSSCTQCVFFDDHQGNKGTVANDAGLCRYNPPVSQPDPDSRGLWPVVTAHDWCGHFTAPHGKASPAAAG